MDQIKILKRALNITVNYRVLWIFGILLALTVGSSGGNGGGNSGTQFDSSNNGSDSFDWENLFNGENPFKEFPGLTTEFINNMMGVLIVGLIVLACVIIILSIIGTVVRYVAETSLIRMVDEYENTGEKLTFREGWRLGWSGAAWKMFLMDLLTGLIFLAALIVAIMVAAIPLLVWATNNTPLQVLGTIISVGLIFLLIFAAILVAIALNLVLLFARRALALENLGVIEALRRGYEIVKGRLGDIILMGLIMFGLNIVWSLAMLVVFLAIALVAAVIGGLPALLIGGLASLFTQGATPWILAAIVGLPIFLVVIFIPAAVTGGWEQVFTSSTWTLTYREALALAKTKENDELPAPQAAG